MELKAALGLALKELRTEKGVTQEKLAELSDLDVTFISRIENGRRQPSLTTIFTISSALKIKPSTLIKNAEDRM